MNWIFWAFLGAAIIHIFEEYLYPGGFLDTLKGFEARFTPFATANFAIIINTLFILLCIAGILIGDKNPVFSLSIASLLLINALVHMGSTIRARKYIPGTFSGTFLYLPLPIYAYYLFVNKGQSSFLEVILSLLLGALYQVVPLIYLLISSRRRV